MAGQSRPPATPTGLIDWFGVAGRTPKRGDAMLLVPAPKPRRTRTFGPRARKSGRMTRVVLGAAAATAVTAGAVAAFGGGDEESTATALVPAISTAPKTTSPASQCGPATEPGVVRGNGPGGTDSGPAAILAFEHAYYVARDGVKAREVVAEDAHVNPAESIQAGADDTPAGTVHCVVIRPEIPGQFYVEITEYRPATAEPKLIRQRITTVTSQGRTLITDISRA